MAHFPADIVADILSRLPVKPLLRFRCVSKLWCALIDGSDFIDLHLKRSTRTNRYLMLKNHNDAVYSVSLYPLDVAVVVDHGPLKNCFEYEPWVLGSCDGLVLLHKAEGNKEQLAIWNPSTRKFQIIPIAADIDHPSQKNKNIYGIGYDSVHNDYKVVHITMFYGRQNGTFRYECKVYNLKLNSWKKINMDLPYYLSLDRTDGKLASGALHWVGTKGDDFDDCSIVAFDLATDEYRILSIPSFDDTEFDMEVSALEGCLCLSRGGYLDGHFEMWVMKDYGVQQSWTQLLSVPPIGGYRICGLIPLALSMDGTNVLLLQDHKKLVWFDLKRKVVNTVNVGLTLVSQAEFCVQSLVPIGRGNKSGGKKQHTEENKEKKPKKTGKKRRTRAGSGSSGGKSKK